MNKLLALADRVEKLTGPDRSIDGMIAEATGEYPCWAPMQNVRQPELFTDGKPGTRAREWLAPKFTASLDAAMTLVPEGWGWTVGDKSPDPSLAWCEIDHLPWHEGYGWAVERKLIVQAATPALALICAALRARAHGGGEG
ncbi:hypothetical protein [uncultured Novosphingobium sp.]|uniref:hypothetical protein n=1 Tax=uncultured Novosphingobium sp. TaxID=292277 RepID=UPI0037487905